MIKPFYIKTNSQYSLHFTTDLAKHAHISYATVCVCGLSLTLPVCFGAWAFPNLPYFRVKPSFVLAATSAVSAAAATGPPPPQATPAYRDALWTNRVLLLWLKLLPELSGNSHLF